MSRAALVLVLAGCVARPGFDEVTAEALPGLAARLPSGFFWGTATAGQQIEGGLTSDWSAWELGSFPDGGPHIRDRATSAVACDSWRRFGDDLAAITGAGSTMYRFSIEWSRLEPVRGQFDDAALATYVNNLRALRDAGVEPMVTLNHFALPTWVAAQGGWESQATSDDFVAYVRHVAPVLAPHVDWYLTLNEPNVYSVFGYLAGQWPPGVTDDTVRQTRVLANLLRTHGRAAAALRELDTVDADADTHPTRISLAHHVRSMLPASHSVLDQFITAVTDDYFNESTPRALVTGRLYLDVPGAITIDEVVPGLAGSVDFLAVQFYSRYVIRGDLGSAALSTQTYRAGSSTNDLGWEVYPDGLYEFLTRFTAYGLPLIITENGIPDAEGSSRATFIARHVAATLRAIDDGAPVRGYLHWSLMDNFEWAEGYQGRFGLYAIDFAQGDLTRRPTAAVAPFRAAALAIPR